MGVRKRIKPEFNGLEQAVCSGNRWLNQNHERIYNNVNKKVRYGMAKHNMESRGYFQTVLGVRKWRKPEFHGLVQSVGSGKKRFNQKPR